MRIRSKPISARQGGKSSQTRWEKVDILLRGAGCWLTPIIVLYLGATVETSLKALQAESALQLQKSQENSASERQQNETNAANLRLNSELLTQREQSESALRKDMFARIVESFFKEGSDAPAKAVLNLELLTYNFHESLDLKPLFRHVRAQLVEHRSKHPVQSAQLEQRLLRVVEDTRRKQVALLESAGARFDATLVENDPIGQSRCLTVEGKSRRFTLFSSKFDHERREVPVRLKVTPVDSCDADPAPTATAPIDAHFQVGDFNLPMMDNVRLPQDARFAVVQNDFYVEHGVARAEVTAICFPGSRAGLRERPYVEEVLNRMLAAGKPREAPSQPELPGAAAPSRRLQALRASP